MWCVCDLLSQPFGIRKHHQKDRIWSLFLACHVAHPSLVCLQVFVNVVKYKLDHMRRKIETEERDSASRASFKCSVCEKTFTDLEADQLIDFTTSEFKCTYCSSPVVEDESATPKQDSRTVIARFNEQIEPLYVLLREVEDIKLAPALLEPEPTDVSHLKTLVCVFNLFNKFYSASTLYILTHKIVGLFQVIRKKRCSFVFGSWSG